MNTECDNKELTTCRVYQAPSRPASRDPLQRSFWRNVTVSVNPSDHRTIAQPTDATVVRQRSHARQCRYSWKSCYDDTRLTHFLTHSLLNILYRRPLAIVRQKTRTNKEKRENIIKEKLSKANQMTSYGKLTLFKDSGLFSPLHNKIFLLTSHTYDLYFVRG